MFYAGFSMTWGIVALHLMLIFFIFIYLFIFSHGKMEVPRPGVKSELLLVEVFFFFWSFCLFLGGCQARGRMR